MEHSHLVLSILGVITCWASEPSPMLNLYQTVSDSVDIENLLEYDCLDYYVRDDIVRYDHRSTLAHQLITYCRRPSSGSEVQTHGEISPLDASNFTFKELKSRDVTAIQLQQWSATIDIVERYQAYLTGDRMANDSDLYYNCTSPWFGSRCEYALSPWGEISLAQTVYYTFAYMEMHQPVDVPCYTLLQV